jgi:hypothetical protein
LFKVQKKAIRTITKSAYNAHTLPLFIEHKILPLEKIIKQGMLLFMHSINYNYAPKSFANVWRKNNEREANLTLRNDDDFVLPNPRIEFYKKMPIYSLPQLWNNSGNLRFYDLKITFKRVLKDQLFEELTAE